MQKLNKKELFQVKAGQDSNAPVGSDAPSVGNSGEVPVGRGDTHVGGRGGTGMISCSTIASKSEQANCIQQRLRARQNY